MTAVTLAPHPGRPVAVPGWEICGYNMLLPVLAGVVLIIMLCFCSLGQRTGSGLLVGNHIVDASSLVSFYQCLV
jgi:hypothetical protein